MTLSNFIQNPRLRLKLPPLLAAAALTGGLGVALGGAAVSAMLGTFVCRDVLLVLLGGSVTGNAMTLSLGVLVGLGLGAAVAGRAVVTAVDPLRCLIRTLMLLLLLQFLWWCALQDALSAALLAGARVATTLGLPPAAYAAGATAVVLLPMTALAGAALAITAEVCQRRLAFRGNGWLGLLLGVGGLGAACASVLCGGETVARIGYGPLLAFALSLQAFAVLLLRMLAAMLQRAVLNDNDGVARQSRSGLQPLSEDILALGLGLCTAAYTLYLLRLLPWHHGPRSEVLATIMFGALAAWSAGAMASACFGALTSSTGLRIAALACAASISMFAMDRPAAFSTPLDMALFMVSRGLYFLPCLLSGYLFGRLCARVARQWGPDVGRLCGWAALGACGSVVAMEFVAARIPFFVIIAVIALVTCALQEFVHHRDNNTPGGAAWPRWALPIGLAALAIGASWMFDLSGTIPGVKIHPGRGGDIAVTAEDSVLLSGLAQTSLRPAGEVDHEAWLAAVSPFMCRDGAKFKRVCVVGMGCGVVTGTVAAFDSVQRVDAFDRFGLYSRLQALYPKRTTSLVNNGKVRILEDDARFNMALHPQHTYDLILVQAGPLWRCGSSRLHTREFFELMRHRLNSGGLCCVHAQGSKAQAFSVRQTAAEVFPQYMSLFGGHVLMLSNEPIDMSVERLAARLGQEGAAWKAVREHPATASPTAFQALWDDPPVDWGSGELVVEDLQPFLEYQVYLDDVVVPLRPLPPPTATAEAEATYSSSR